jgi:GNAT superfamily N-acetyltransferase
MAEVTEATWARIFDPLEPVHAVVAERGDALIGFSHYVFRRSTWLVNARCYLQDLFVSPRERGGGVGRALIGGVAAAAKEVGAANVYWNTHELNAAARRLYDAVADRTGFTQYRIDRLAFMDPSESLVSPGLPLRGTSLMLPGLERSSYFTGAAPEMRRIGARIWSQNVLRGGRCSSPNPMSRRASMLH